MERAEWLKQMRNMTGALSEDGLAENGFPRGVRWSDLHGRAGARLPGGLAGDHAAVS